MGVRLLARKRKKKKEITKHFLFLEWGRINQKILEGLITPAKIIKVNRVLGGFRLLEQESRFFSRDQLNCGKTVSG